MNKFLTAAVVSGTLLSQPAHAALHVYEFTATVRQMGPLYDHVPDPDAYEGWEAGKIIDLGDRIVGRFTFEDSRAPWAYAGSTANFAETSLYLNSFSFSMPESGLGMNASQATMIGRRTDSQHELEMWVRDDVHFVWGNVVIRTAATADQPYAIRFDPAGQNLVNFRWWTAQEQYWLIGDVTSFAEVSPVPEPSTYAMLIAGMALVAGAARKRRARTP